jgi:hypothetical protein
MIGTSKQKFLCGPLLASRLALALLVFSAGHGPALASESVAEPHEHYRVLQWQDLVPEGWDAPLVPTAYDEVSAADVDEASVVKDLDKQLVVLPGYMRPTVYDGNQVSEFLLVPFLPHQITAHAHLEPNQMVYVYAIEPILVEQPFEPIWVIGTISPEAVMTHEGPAAYRMVEAVTTDYEY